MTLPKDVELTDELRRYMVEHGRTPDTVAQELIAQTQALGGIAEMQIPPEQGALLTMLAQILGARLVVEVGTFTGYSTLCLARGLSPGGQIVTCDLSDEWTSIGRQAWQRAGMHDLVDLRLGPAAKTLASLATEPGVDLAFIDADKTGYIGYWEQLVPRLRPGGLIVVDNVFYGGAVVDTDAVGNAAAIRAFNDHARDDSRMELVMLPVADGLTLARKPLVTTGGTP
jgi:caffeoyl-CoA O-methyltransferase